MDRETSTHTGGISFMGLLTILFIALKLTGYIQWSWWWVLAPLWGSIVFALAVMLVILMVGVLFDWLTDRS